MSQAEKDECFFREWRDQRQSLVGNWCLLAFGPDCGSVPHRGLRMLEEALETGQVAGVTKEKAMACLEYVYSRPVGDLKQELGGLGVTVLALAHAAHISADMAERDEVLRVLSKPLEHFKHRDRLKIEQGLV